MYIECEATGGGRGESSAASLPMAKAQNSNSAAAASCQQEQPQATNICKRLDEMIAGDSRNFDSWTALIAEVEKTCPDYVDTISLAYDTFLSKFPLCHWYWRKYAYHILRISDPQKAVDIFEQALDSAMYSLGLWVDYCRFAMCFYGDKAAVRKLFKIGILFVGKDYLCHALWDQYIKFEYSQENWSSLANIYVQVLRYPTEKLHEYYDYFKKFVAGMEEEMKQQKNYMIEPEDGVQPTGTTSLSEKEISKVIEDMQNPSDEARRSKAVHEYKIVGNQFYQKACELDDKIKCYESNIQRQYFDVTPLDDEQLKNWHQYLDFIENQGDFLWTLQLYERCLIPCANYPEFWMRYVEFMESKGGRELANFALQRATEIFLKDVPEIHLFNARFKERIGDASAARAALVQRDMGSDSYLTKHVIELANMERRLGNLEGAYDIYEKAIHMAEEKKQWNSLSTLFIHLSRLKYMITRSVDAARDVMIDGIKCVPHSRFLLEELIKFGMMHQETMQVNLLDSVIANAIYPSSDGSQGLNPKDREDISSLFLEFVDLCGTVDDVRKARNRHIQLFPHIVRASSVCKLPDLGNCLSNEISEQRQGSSSALPHLQFEGKERKTINAVQEQVHLLPVNHDYKPDLVCAGHSPRTCDEKNEQERGQQLTIQVVEQLTEAPTEVNELAHDLVNQSVDDAPESVVESIHKLAEQTIEDEPCPMEIMPTLVQNSCEDTSGASSLTINFNDQSRPIALLEASQEHSSSPNLQEQVHEHHPHPGSFENPSLKSPEQTSQELLPWASDEQDVPLETSERNIPQDCLNSNTISPTASPNTSNDDSAQVQEQSRGTKSASLLSLASHQKHTPIEMQLNSVVSPSTSGECQQRNHAVTIPEGESSEFHSYSEDKQHQHQQTSWEQHDPTVAFCSPMLPSQQHGLVSDRSSKAKVHHEADAVQENMPTNQLSPVNHAQGQCSFPTNQLNMSSPLVSCPQPNSPMNFQQSSQHPVSNQNETSSQIWQYQYQQQQYQHQLLQMLQQQQQQQYQQQQYNQQQVSSLQHHQYYQTQQQVSAMPYQMHQLQKQQTPYFQQAQQQLQQNYQLLTQQEQLQQGQQHQFLQGYEQHGRQSYKILLQEYHLNQQGYGHMWQQQQHHQQLQDGYIQMMQQQQHQHPQQQQQNDGQIQQQQQRSSEQDPQHNTGQRLQDQDNVPEGSDSL